jgi:NAD(P)-dependent dehydrogenase (short-subunit alcohol dehydrogenase family)
MKRTVFITGASSGFGKESVQLFHEKGWNVVATMRSPSQGSAAGLDGVLVERLDVTDAGSIEAAVASAIRTFGQIDVLVNNAGYGALGALEAASDAEIRRQMEVNLFGLIAVTKGVLPFMRARRSGVIVNVSSMGGRLPFPFSTLYNATKFAVEGLTESLQFELNPLGIRTKLTKHEFFWRCGDRRISTALGSIYGEAGGMGFFREDPGGGGCYLRGGDGRVGEAALPGGT